MGWNTIGRMADVIGILGLLVSLRTWWLVRNFKKAIVRRDEKTRFLGKQDTLVKRFKGYKEYIIKDNRYNGAVLQNASEDITEVLADYSFLSGELKRQLRGTKKHIDRRCIKDLEKNRSNRRDELCDKLIQISSLLQKEVVFYE